MDYWTLGVMTYVLLTAKQPFGSGKTTDPMEVRHKGQGMMLCVLGAGVTRVRH